MPEESGSLVQLAGSERAPLPAAEQAGTLDPAQRAEITVVLRRRAALPAEIVTGPTVLSTDELAEQYGADPADVELVRRELTSRGLEITAVHPATRRVMVAGTIGELSQAFGTTLRQVSSPDPAGDGQVTHRYREGPLYVPAELADVVTAVLGLDTRPQVKPHFRAAAAARGTSYTPAEVADIYAFPAGTTGAGQTIAVIELGGGYTASDLDAYFASLGITTPSVTAVGVDGAANDPSDTSGANVEVSLDIDVIGAAAPGAAQVVYFAPNDGDQGFVDAISTAAQASPAPVAISISWGQSEDSWTAQGRAAMNAAMSDAAALGITVCVASGDNGSTDGVSDGQQHVDFPASSPYALGCGGTKLTADAATGTVTSEVVWNEGSQGGAGGGGVSDEFAVPTWQADAGVRPVGRVVRDGSRRAGRGGQRRPADRVPDLLRRPGPGGGRDERRRAAVGGPGGAAGRGHRPAVRPAPVAGLRGGVAGDGRGRLPRHHQREQRRVLGRAGLGRLHRARLAGRDGPDGAPEVLTD